MQAQEKTLEGLQDAACELSTDVVSASDFGGSFCERHCNKCSIGCTDVNGLLWLQVGLVGSLWQLFEQQLAAEDCPFDELDRDTDWKQLCKELNFSPLQVDEFIDDFALLDCVILCDAIQISNRLSSTCHTFPMHRWEGC